MEDNNSFSWTDVLRLFFPILTGAASLAQRSKNDERMFDDQAYERGIGPVEKNDRIDWVRSHRDLGLSEDYLGNLYDKYHGSEYWDMVNSDPALNDSRRASGWDNFVSSIGFTSSYDTYRSGLNNALSSNIQQIESNKYENAYNSPSAQANRMRQAGMNPDLTGTNGVAGAAEFNEPQSLPELQPNLESALNVGATVMSSISDAASRTMAFIGGLQQMHGVSLDNAIKEDSLGKTDDDYLIDIIGRARASLDPNSENYEDSVDAAVKSYIESLTSSKQRKRLLDRYNDASSWLQSEIHANRERKEYDDSIIDSATSRGKLDAYRNSPLNTSPGSSYYDSVRSVTSALSKMELEAIELSNRVNKAHGNADIARSGYESSYYNNLNGSDMAGYDTNQAKHRNFLADYEQKVKNIQYGLIKQLEKDSKNGNLFATYFLWNFATSGAIGSSASQLAELPGTIAKIFK